MLESAGTIFSVLMVVAFLAILYAPTYYRDKRKRDREEYLQDLQRRNNINLAKYDRGEL